MITQIIGDINSITIITEDKTVTWDDVREVEMETYEDICYNYCCEETIINKGYDFRFYTRQDTLKDELCKVTQTPKKFELCYKDSDNKNSMIIGEVEDLNIQEGTLDSYIQVFLREFQVHEDKREEIRQACNLKKEDVEQLEKTLLTNNSILQPLTQSTTATISTGGFMDNSICSTYDPSFYIRTSEVTIGDKSFKTTDLANALDKIVNNDKIASSTTKEDEIVRWEKVVCKEDFCISDNPCANITYVNPETMEPFSIGTIIEKGQLYYRLTGASLKEFIEWNKENNKEDKNMFNKIFNKYKFGKLDTKDIAYSMNGIAFRTSDGSYVVYNKDLTFTNVDNLVMDIPVFVMPVALSEIKPGDVIVHYGVGQTAFVIVDSINDTDIFISDPHTRERKNLIPEKSIFGFDFVAKVMTPNTMFAADQSNPFGNMLPFMLMGEDANTDNLGLMMLLGHSSGEASWANQYLPLMLMDKGDNDMFKYMILMQMMNQNKETK